MVRPHSVAALFLGAAVAAGSTSCGGSASVANDGTGNPTNGGSSSDGGGSGNAADGGTGSDGGTTSGGACNADAVVTMIASCIDLGTGPRACLERARQMAPLAAGDACDVDQDALDDALEDAMLRSYAPVFAYNQGDGGHTAGSSEPNYPVNAKHFVSHSTLAWRVDNDATTMVTVVPKPTLDGLPGAIFQYQGTSRAANSTALGQGPNFWLCLEKPNGNYSDEALVTTMDASRNLPDGIDVFSVAHPSGGDASGKYIVLEYMLFYAYNTFSLDNHEGDFEGGAVFVDAETGAVVAAWTDRHATADTEKLIPLAGPGALVAKDPTNEAPHYDVCDPTDTSSIGGVRFWDYSGPKHHPVIYPAAGGHASYGYPGATKIQGVGCVEATIIRDVHNGIGPKFAPAEGAFYTDWGRAQKEPVVNGVHFVNLGERAHLRAAAAWSAFAGQWGCTLDSIPKSYPGPWDNARLCRHWLTNDWGDAMPFTPSTATSCQ